MRVITIGRSNENDVIVNDPHASRHHMQIIQHDDGRYTISDFGSANGTYVNGQKISGEIVLAPTDIIRIGKTTIPWMEYFTQDTTDDTPNVAPEPNEENLSDTQVTPVEKRRNGFVTFWLWLMIVANAGSVIMQLISANYATWQYATSEKATQFFYGQPAIIYYYIGAAYFIAILSLVNVAGAIFLLKWKKLGYWLFVGSAAACFTIMVSFAIIGGITIPVGSSMFGAVSGPVALWAIMQIRKNGISCWRQLA